MSRIDHGSGLVEASPAWVYRALTDPGLLVAWLPPRGARAVIDEFDPRPDGAFSMTLIFNSSVQLPGKSSADRDVVKGRFVHLVPDREVSQRFEFESSDPLFAGAMTMTWKLEPAGPGTLVKVAAENVPPGISAEDHEAGIGSSLENLAALARRSHGG